MGHKNKQYRLLSISSLVIGLLIVSIMYLPTLPMGLADGNDSPQVCEDFIINVDSTDVGQSGSVVTFTAASGFIVNELCIKDGEGTFNGGTSQHSGLITSDGDYGDGGCYNVDGIGTATVTVSKNPGNLLPAVDRNGNPVLRECRNISHIDVGVQMSTPPAETTLISGMKFEDLDGDGTKDVGEPGIEDWDITLDCDDNSLDDTTSTDSDGNYEFSFDLSVSTACTITEGSVSGWTSTTPTSIDIDPVEPGETYPGNDFGNFEDVTIMGEKWEDTNGDGIDNSNSEPRLSDWTIFLDLDSDGINNNDDISDITDVDGKYSFGPLGPQYAGDAQICEELEDGWTNTHPGQLCIPITISSGNDLGATLPDDDTDFGNLFPIRAEKTWTKTDYNWGPVCELVLDELVCRPANINNPDDDVLADPLLQDPNDNYLAYAQVNVRKNTFQNTNPGAFYAVTTVEVLADLDTLTVEENYGGCTSSPGILQLLPSNVPSNAVKAAIVDSNGDVTELSGDVTVTFVSTGAIIEIPGPVQAGDTVIVLVKFQVVNSAILVNNGIVDMMCHNIETVTSEIGDIESEVDAEAWLRITNQS